MRHEKLNLLIKYACSQLCFSSVNIIFSHLLFRYPNCCHFVESKWWKLRSIQDAFIYLHLYALSAIPVAFQFKISPNDNGREIFYLNENSKPHYGRLRYLIFKTLLLLNMNHELITFLRVIALPRNKQKISFFYFCKLVLFRYYHHYCIIRSSYYIVDERTHSGIEKRNQRSWLLNCLPACCLELKHLQATRY